MRLKDFVLLAALLGAAAATGCNDDGEESGTGGAGGTTDGTGGATGGTGGSDAGDACKTGPCADASAEQQASCAETVAFCNSDACCSLPDGDIDPDAASCDMVGQSACELEPPEGTGGSGGAGLGGSGLGGGGGDGDVTPRCDWTGVDVCDTCVRKDLTDVCVAVFDLCLDNHGASDQQCTGCAIIAFSECSELVTQPE